MADQLAPVRGVGCWIWELASSEGGDVQAIIRRCKDNNIDYVLVKAADGGEVWPQWTSGLVEQLRKAGIRCLAWAYVYGTAATEAAAARTAMAAAKPDAWVIDSEKEVEGLNDPASFAQAYCSSISAAHPDVPLYLSSFPIVEFHPQPWATYKRFCAAFLPQIYWADLGHSPESAIEWCMASMSKDAVFQDWTIVPTGQTYNVGVDEVSLFARTAAQTWPHAGINWWSWQHTQADAWASVYVARAAYLRKPPPAPTARYVVTTPQHLRQQPSAEPMNGPLLPVGTKLEDAAGWTPHWRRVKVVEGALAASVGWMLQTNIKAV